MNTTLENWQSRRKPLVKTLALPNFAVLQGVALYGLCFTLLCVLIFATPGFLGNDDYYHARMSSVLWAQGRLAIEFPWLPKTILSPEQFVDHHLLYHIYLAPWVHFGGLTGAKWAQVTVAAAVFAAIWLLLRDVGVRWPALWTVALFGLSSPFLYRLLMIRTQGAAVLLLVIALQVMFRRRYRWLIPLAFANAWLYNGFILMPAFVVLYVAAEWLTERRLNWQPIAYSGVGILLGLVINPYFPQNFAFIIEHLGAKVDFERGIQVGIEWYPYTIGALFAHSGGALLILFAGFLRPHRNRRRDTVELTLAFAALLTLFMLFQSRRFIEYYPPFALLFCAVAWGRQPLQGFLSHRWIRFGTGTAVLLGVVFIGAVFVDTRRTIENSDDPRWFSGASNWLESHTPAGTLVFQTDWDDFPQLFYYNNANTYLVGLDPTYLERANPDLWTQWVAITRGEVEQPSTVIQTVFGSDYVVSDRQHEAFAQRAYDDPRMRLVYWDKNSMVWQITPESDDS
jgi:hypothetical protein